VEAIGGSAQAADEDGGLEDRRFSFVNAGTARRFTVRAKRS
jgi:hypothetical protein